MMNGKEKIILWITLTDLIVMLLLLAHKKS